MDEDLKTVRGAVSHNLQDQIGKRHRVQITNRAGIDHAAQTKRLQQALHKPEIIGISGGYPLFRCAVPHASALLPPTRNTTDETPRIRSPRMRAFT